MRNNYLSTSFLDSLSKSINLGLVGQLDGGLALAQQGNDGYSGVTTDDWDGHCLRVDTVDLTDEGSGTDHV